MADTKVDVEAEVLRVRGRIAAAQRARGRAEMEHDAARAAAGKAQEQLAGEFGVSTVDEARTMLAALEQELGDAVTELRAKLDNIGV